LHVYIYIYVGGANKTQQNKTKQNNITHINKLNIIIIHRTINNNKSNINTETIIIIKQENILKIIRTNKSY